MTWLESHAGLTLALVLGAGAMTFGAALIRGLTGFGMAIILVPLLGLIMLPGEAVVLGILLQLLIGPVGIRVIYRDSDRASAVPIALVAMGATPLGLMLLRVTGSDVARLAIALVAIGAFLLVLLPARPGHRPGRAATALTGIASGVLTGFAAMPGPPVVPYYLRQAMAPLRARASMMLIFFATAIAGTVAAQAMGLATARLWWLAVILFPAVLAGNWLGGLAFGRVPPHVWRTAVAIVLGIAGVSALLRLAA